MKTIKLHNYSTAHTSYFSSHYLGCAKTFALMSKYLADVNLKMMKKS